MHHTLCILSGTISSYFSLVAKSKPADNVTRRQGQRIHIVKAPDPLAAGKQYLLKRWDYFQPKEAH